MSKEQMQKPPGVRREGEIAPSDWRDRPVPALDHPNLRDRVGELIAKNAGRKRKAAERKE